MRDCRRLRFRELLPDDLSWLFSTRFVCMCMHCVYQGRSHSSSKSLLALLCACVAVLTFRCRMYIPSRNSRQSKFLTDAVS